MNQTPLDFDLHQPVTQPQGCDRVGFDIGWDHARHALVPPPELLLPGSPVCQGWMGGRAVFGGRTLAATPAVRQWLALRLLAWRQGIAFDTEQLTPQALAQLGRTHCPVLRLPLGGVPAAATAARLVRLDTAAGYGAGHLAMLSRAADEAGAGLDALACLRRARAARVADGAAPAEGSLDAAAWLRLGVLKSFATPLPFAQAAQLPLAVLPPHRVRLRNAVQRLQTLLTLLFTRPGWAARARQVAALLPGHTVRHDFNLWVGALVPRVLAAGAHPDARTLGWALEDAWTQDRVQRRWTHFVLSLGEAGTADLLQRAAALCPAGPRAAAPAPVQATDGPAPAQPAAALPTAVHAAAGARAVPVVRPAPRRRQFDRPAA